MVSESAELVRQSWQVHELFFAKLLVCVAAARRRTSRHKCRQLDLLDRDGCLQATERLVGEAGHEKTLHYLNYGELSVGISCREALSGDEL